MAYRVIEKRGVYISVNGRVYEADCPFNLRNVLLCERNELHAAAREVEAYMALRHDPTLVHLTTLPKVI